MKKSNTDFKPDARRVSRFENEIQSIVSLYIIQNLQSELPGLITIGRVQVPGDLRTANIFVSLLDISSDKTPAQKVHDLESALKTLQAWAKDMQSEIDSKLKMRYVPKLTFFADSSTEKILKIEKILSDMGAPKDIDDIEDEDL